MAKEHTIPEAYRNPSAVYRMPAPAAELAVTYNGAACRAAADPAHAGFQCGNTFLKVHGSPRQYLLVPAGQIRHTLLLARIDAAGRQAPLPTPERELLMHPIASDFVDVHGGDGDCR